MSNIFHVGDLHLGHGNVTKWRVIEGVMSPESPLTAEEHDEWMLEQWNSIIRKRDTVFVHGDAVVYPRGFETLSKMAGNKILIMGNHDGERHGLSITDYVPHFSKIQALVKRKGFWLSHAPIHPVELRGKPNIHGHVHENSINDPRYINVSVEGNWERNGTIFSSAAQIDSLMLERFPLGKQVSIRTDGRQDHSYFPVEGGH